MNSINEFVYSNRDILFVESKMTQNPTVIWYKNNEAL